MLPKMSEYAKSFGETKYLSLLFNDDILLKKCNKIWNKVSSSIKKKKDLTVNQCKIKSIQILMKIKSIQIFMMMECLTNISLYLSISNID